MWKLDHVRSDGTARAAYAGQIQDIVKYAVTTEIMIYKKNLKEQSINDTSSMMGLCVYSWILGLLLKYKGYFNFMRGLYLLDI